MLVDARGAETVAAHMSLPIFNIGSTGTPVNWSPKSTCPPKSTGPLPFIWKIVDARDAATVSDGLPGSTWESPEFPTLSSPCNSVNARERERELIQICSIVHPDLRLREESPREGLPNVPITSQGEGGRCVARSISNCICSFCIVNLLWCQQCIFSLLSWFISIRYAHAATQLKFDRLF